MALQQAERHSWVPIGEIGCYIRVLEGIDWVIQLRMFLKLGCIGSAYGI